ncbi:MAG: acyltransferase family protein [Halobacteriota archaeon]
MPAGRPSKEDVMAVAEGESGTTLPPRRLSDRLYFADNLRTYLITLVVLHHLAIVYTGAGAFYYVEPTPIDQLALAVLVIFIALNQAYFMGLLFLISAYFSPGSLERKGVGRFVKDRLIRLGIPLLIFFFVLNPIAAIGSYAMPASVSGITTPLSWQAYPQLVGVGPMWFVAMLLVFDIGFAIWWAARRNRMPRQESSNEPPRYRAIAAFILVLALTSYLIRIVIPIGEFVAGFPTLSYLPQYVSFFIIGIVAVRHNWLRNVPKSMGRAGFALVLVATIIVFPIAISGGATNVAGYGSWQSAVYAVWDSTVAVGMSLGLITLFRERFNWSGSFTLFLQRHSYTVYVIQAPIIVFVVVALMGLSLEHLLKFGLAAVITVPLCFAAAYLVLKIPFASRVL